MLFLSKPTLPTFLIVLGLLIQIGSADILVTNSNIGTRYSGTIDSTIVGGGTAQVGLSVTVQYNTFSETAIWTDENANKGSSVSALFIDGWSVAADVEGGSGNTGTFGDSDESLSADGILDTVNEHWSFAQDGGKLPGGSVLQKITLDGSAANIVFDRPVFNGVLVGTPYNPTEASGDGGLASSYPHEGADQLSNFVGTAAEFGTASSHRGRDFYSESFDNSTETSVEVTYSNQVDGFGDLFTRVEIFFPGGLDPGSMSSFNFAIDTDKTMGLTAVPEPAGVVVLSIIGLGFCVVTRRRTERTRKTP